MIDSSSVGMFEMYSKVQKKQTYFLLWSGEKDKKTDTRTQVDFFFPYFIVFRRSWWLPAVRRTAASCGGLPRSLTTHPPLHQTSCFLSVGLGKSSSLVVTQTHHSEEFTAAWESECSSQDAANPFDPASQVDLQESSHSFWYFIFYFFFPHLRLDNTHAHACARTHIEMHSPVDPMHISFQVKHNTLCVSTPCHEQVFIVS